MGCHPSHWLSYFSRWLLHHQPVKVLILFWLVVWNTALIFPFSWEILGMSSSQLTKSIIFQRGRAQPPTRLLTIINHKITIFISTITNQWFKPPTRYTVFISSFLLRRPGISWPPKKTPCQVLRELGEVNASLQAADDSKGFCHW